MLRGQIRLGHIFGIEIGLHFSWFIIAALLTMSLAGHLYSVNREWPTGLVWTAAGVAALAFFAAILLHELSHAAVARARGVDVPVDCGSPSSVSTLRMPHVPQPSRPPSWKGCAASVSAT
jgi:hypothetical protein